MCSEIDTQNAKKAKKKTKTKQNTQFSRTVFFDSILRRCKLLAQPHQIFVRYVTIERRLDELIDVDVELIETL